MVLISAQAPPATDLALDRLLRWLDAVQVHAPGNPDAPAVEVGSWSPGAIETLAGDVVRLSSFFQKAREDRLGPLPTIEIYGRRFTLVEIEKIFHGNDTLRSGAVLHADVAALVEDDRIREQAADDSGAYVVGDGRATGVRSESGHWRIGRMLLDAVKPNPAEDAGVLLWYRAVSAHLLDKGHLGQARAHLDRARQMFPGIPDFQVDTAYLHQRLSSAAIQTAVQELRARGRNPAVDSRRAELDRVERFLRQALSLDPALVDARMRLGHTLGLLGHHDDAAMELRAAIDGRPAGATLYFAELFLGDEEQALGRPDEARRHYENAAELYPRAQSPQLALSQSARQSGDRTAALRALKGMLALPVNENDRFDPWWEYYEFHQEDVDRLMTQMRGLAKAAVR